VSSIPTGASHIAAFERHIADNPLVTYAASHPGSDAFANTDLLSERQWRNLGVYADHHRPLGLEHILVIAASELPTLVGIALFREQTAFSARDCY